MSEARKNKHTLCGYTLSGAVMKIESLKYDLELTKQSNESIREANALLTDQVERLEDENAELRRMLELREATINRLLPRVTPEDMEHLRAAQDEAREVAARVGIQYEPGGPRPDGCHRCGGRGLVEDYVDGFLAGRLRCPLCSPATTPDPGALY